MKEITETFTKAVYPDRWYDNNHYFGISQHILDRDHKFTSGKWYRIKSSYGTIYRVLRYQPQLSAGKGEESAEISVDYDGGKILGFNRMGNNQIKIEIRSISLHEYVLATLNHPDPTFRIASWLGLIALFIGGLSLISGLLSVILSLIQIISK